MPIPEQREALIDWVNSFPLLAAVHDLKDLSNGVALAKILHEIAPEHFAVDMIAKTTSASWAIDLTNLKKLMRCLEEYYLMVLELHADFESIELMRVCKEKNLAEIVRILGFVIIAAIRSPDRNRFYVQQMIALPPESQAVLKDIIEEAMRCTQPAGQQVPSPKTSFSLVEDLQDTLAKEVETREQVERENLQQKGQLMRVTEEAKDLQHSLSHCRDELDTQQKRVEASQRQAEDLRTQMVSLTSRLEEREMASEQLRQQMTTVIERQRMDKETWEKTMEASRRMEDELDVMRANAAEHSRVKATLNKYKQKLEQVASARQHIEELGEQNAKYLDQILALEDEVKAMSSLKATIEQHKQQVLEAERARYQVEGDLHMKDAEVNTLREEIDALQDARRFLTDELNALRSCEEEHVVSPVNGGLSSLDLYSAQDRERIVRLERDNNVLRAQVEASGVNGGIVEDPMALQSQLQIAEKLKEERGQEARQARTRCAELEADLRMLRGHLEEIEEELNQQRTDRDSTSKNALMASDAALSQLKAKVTESEATIVQLRSERDKLEQYTRKTLQTVQDKYVSTLEGLKKANTELKERNVFLEERLTNDKALHKREERLLMSAIYELGLDMMGIKNGQKPPRREVPQTSEGTSRDYESRPEPEADERRIRRTQQSRLGG